MAEPTRSIFNKNATEKLHSPDDLDRYVRVTSPSVWVILMSVFALMLGLLAWGVFGTISTSVSTMATIVNGRTLCLLDSEAASTVQVGDLANVNGYQMHVTSVATVPVSVEEAKGMLVSDYLVDELMDGDWAYLVVLDSDEETQLVEGVPLSVSITTESVSPISLVLG